MPQPWEIILSSSIGAMTSVGVMIWRESYAIGKNRALLRASMAELCLGDVEVVAKVSRTRRTINDLRVGGSDVPVVVTTSALHTMCDALIRVDPENAPHYARQVMKHETVATLGKALEHAADGLSSPPNRSVAIDKVEIALLFVLGAEIDAARADLRVARAVAAGDARLDAAAAEIEEAEGLLEAWRSDATARMQFSPRAPSRLRP